MAVSDTIQRRMPTMRDRETGQPLAFPEAVLLTNPSDPQFKGQVTLFLYALFCF
jgi:rhamnogalacturonan endolyase